MFKDADEVEQAERDQDADCARIDAAIDAAKDANNCPQFATEQFSPSATCVTTS